MIVKGKIRGWWPLAAITPFLVAALCLLYGVWHSPPQRRNDLATYGAFAVAVVTLAAGWIAWAWRARRRSAGPAVTGQDLDRVTDLLAMAVKKQWERAAGERGLVDPIPVTWGRPSAPLAGPIGAAAGSRRFAPLPGLTSAREAQLAAGQITDLHAIYGGLRSGRLVIAGAPGSGKSSAAVLLVLAALKHRNRVRAEDRGKVPVPVLFTAQDWDPRRQPVKDWLTGRLQQTYPLFAGQAGKANAGELVDAGRLTVILDGLDEIAGDLRPVALQALNQASFRVVVLSRTAEMASAASQRGVLQGAAAVELRVIGPATAAGFLERVQRDPPPDGWHDLIHRIRASPASPLANAVNSPLALALIRDTYQSEDDARELLDYCDAAQQHGSGAQATEEITDHLLDRVLPNAYANRPGQPSPRYNLHTAHNTLTKIAARMNQDHTRDLQWWRIPEWIPFAQQSERLPARRGKLQWRPILSYFVRDFVLFGLLFGLLLGLGPWFRFGLGPGLGLGFVAGLLCALVYFLPVTFASLDSTGSGSTSPAAAWQEERSFALMRGLGLGLGFGLILGPATGIALGLGFEHNHEAGLVPGLVAGLVTLLIVVFTGLAFGLLGSHIWSTTLAKAQLAWEWHTPVRLITFLEDARERGVLRTVGPVYQFRHARLQDRLAANNNDVTGT